MAVVGCQVGRKTVILLDQCVKVYRPQGYVGFLILGL